MLRMEVHGDQIAACRTQLAPGLILEITLAALGLLCLDEFAAVVQTV